jgi:hypothetical protein
MISFDSVSALLTRLASKLSRDSATRALAEDYLRAPATNSYLHLLVDANTMSLSLRIYHDSGEPELNLDSAPRSWRI